MHLTPPFHLASHTAAPGARFGTAAARLRLRSRLRLRLRQRARALVSGVAIGAAAWAAPAGAAPAGLDAAVHTVPDTLAQRVLPCTPCHGKEGVVTAQGYFPRIAGKPAGYLYNQLRHFREGRRSNGTMSALVENLSDDYLQEIAAHFASLDLPYAPTPQPLRPPPAAEMARGEQLVRRGDAGAQLPACTQCHGAAMTGVQPAIPGLLGLPRDYLLAQFGAWRSGKRHATAPDCMGQISQRLSADDLSAVATYLALQPLPADPKPAASLPQPLPLECGGVAR